MPGLRPYDPNGSAPAQFAGGLGPVADHPGNAAPEYTLVVRRYARFESFFGGFEGDNRQFSTDMKATARTVGLVTFAIRGSGAPTTSGYSSGSSYVGPWAVRKKFPFTRYIFGNIGNDPGQVRVTVENVAHTSTGISFDVRTSGNLPLKDMMLWKPIAGAINKASDKIRPKAPHVQGTPNIDTYIDVNIVSGVGYIDVDGTMRGDDFPDAEVFLLDENQQPAPLLDYRTSGGIAGPVRLVNRGAQGNTLAKFSKRISVLTDGSFKSGAAGQPTLVQEK